MKCRFFLLAILTGTAAAADFHVAPNGNAEDPGTKAKPFPTLARAREAVRGLVSSGLKSDVRVVLHTAAPTLWEHRWSSRPLTPVPPTMRFFMRRLQERQS